MAPSSDLPTRCIAILGRRDQPTDAVEEYCQYLGQALQAQNFTLEIARIPWPELDRSAALRTLRERIGDPQNAWFLLQYTALAWSRRGFPTRVVRVLKFLKKQNAHCAVVFHDAEPYAGDRWIDRFRRRVQLSVMRKLLRLSDVSIFTVPLEKLSWLPKDATNAMYIPVGANLPDPQNAWAEKRDAAELRPVVAIFSITGNPHGLREVRIISDAVTHAAKKLGPLRVVVFGRNAEVGGQDLKTALSGSNVDVTVMGVIPADRIVQLLGSSDVLLFVRGPISSRRGSAIAGIACGLPVIAQEGSETAPPITEAGVVLIPAQNPSEFGPALLRVLSEPRYRASLAERSRNAQTRYFSWSAIASQYAKALRQPRLRPPANK